MADGQNDLVVTEKVSAGALPVLSLPQHTPASAPTMAAPPPTYMEATQGAPSSLGPTSPQGVLPPIQTNAYLQYNHQGTVVQQQPQGMQVVQVVQPMQLNVRRDFEAAEKYQVHLICAILVTILFCWPLGIVAISRATRAKTLAMLGMKKEAQDAGKTSALLSVLAFISGIIIIVFVVVRVTVYSSYDDY